MKIIATSKRATTVKAALEEAQREINQKLSQIDGRIIKMHADARPLGGIEISVVVNGNEPHKKRILGVNESAISAELSIKKAQDRINQMASDTKGEIADFFIKTITAPFGRTYTTMVLAVNERLIKPPNDLSAEERRDRIKSVLLMLNNDPRALNISHLAELFNVSRDIIYKDLEK
ncbi:MAG: HTH domain-containing protein, partial [Euryarchaeota archaeon]|nr:HTH domain-containing protein [Euryarchaeota archaeon]